MTRYQDLVGGNSPKTIGNVLINSGMIKKSGINQELWIFRDWSDNLLVLKLCSGDTTAKIISLEGLHDPITQVIICLAFFYTGEIGISEFQGYLDCPTES